MTSNNFVYLILLVILAGVGCQENSEPNNIIFKDDANRGYWRFYHIIQEFDEVTEVADYVPHYSMLTKSETDTLLTVLEVYAIPYILTVDSVIYVEKSYRGIRNYSMMYTIDSALRERIVWEYWELIKDGNSE